jgi:hypothetical protein
MPDTPLRPDELPTYKTDVETDAEAPDPTVPSPGGDPRPWMVAAIVLLVLFVAVLVAWFAFGLAA